MRVAFISLHTSPAERAGTADAGGMNVLIRALATALQQAGAHVEFFTRRSSADQPATATLDDGLIVHHITAGPATPLPKSQIDAHIDEFRENLGSLDRFDLVHSHHWMSGVAAIPLARAAGIPHLMTFHSVAAHPNSSLRDGEPAESPARIDGEVYCATESDFILAVSRHEAAVVIGRCQADPEQVMIVRPGVDTELFHPADPGEVWVPAPGVKPGYVLFAARLQPLKAPDVAIRALGLIPAEERPDLVIVGQVSADFADYEAELHRFVEEGGVAGEVTFLPGQDRESFARIMRHASVMLVPSYSETFGLVALEASASGIPTLAAAAGGLTEAICNTHTGDLVPTHDPADWAAALLRLLRDPDRRARMGVTARERAESMTWAHVADRTLQAYRRAIANGAVKHVTFIHAHPDDETLASGALIAHLVDEGLKVSVLTCTRGEMGGVVPGPLSYLEGTPALEQRREAELAGALDSLGVHAHAYLGMPPARASEEPRRFLDSGMRWISEGLAGPGEEADERSLTSADEAEATADIAAFLRKMGTDLVVSYDDDGGYGHPDHVRTHHLSRAAADSVGIPFAALTTDREVAARWFDLEGYRPRVAKALRHHRTQLTVHDDDRTITHSGGQADTIVTSTGLRGDVPHLP
ncbi:glycosyltransferase [Tessaracoccus sp. Y1736]